MDAQMLPVDGTKSDPHIAEIIPDICPSHVTDYVVFFSDLIVDHFFISPIFEYGVFFSHFGLGTLG